jgi:quercetin dioxygenase-like cupin family protein
MAIPHAVSGQPIDVGPLGDRLQGEKTLALFKSRDLEVMRVVLQAGKSLPPHKVQGDITIQCIEGVFEVTAEGQVAVLRAGQMLFLAGDVVHSVTAVEDASGLVTVALAR